MNKNTLVVTIVSILLIVGFLFAAYTLTSGPSKPTIVTEVSKLLADDHMKWSAEKKNILVEYSDLQCPACKNFHDYITADLETTRSGQIDVTKNITLIYRHFPLKDLHPNSEESAWAAEAAAKQGKFFEYADKLFDTQADWEGLDDPREFFTTLAGELKLDTEKFTQDMNSQEVKNRVERDYQSGVSYGVNATPTFFLNGQKLDNLRSFEEFRALLEQVGQNK